MFERDLIVGIVATATGIVLVFNSLRPSNEEPRLGTMKFIRRKFGKVNSQRIIFALGCLLIAIGAGLALTSLPNQVSGRRGSTSDNNLNKASGNLSWPMLSQMRPCRIQSFN